MATQYKQKIGTRTNLIFPVASTDGDATALLALLEGGVTMEKEEGQGSVTTERPFPEDDNFMVLIIGDKDTKHFEAQYLRGMDPTKSDLVDLTATITANFDKQYDKTGAPNFVQKRGDRL